MLQGLLRHFHDLPLLERAARCAVGCWFDSEQGFCNAIQHAQGPDQIFPDGWFHYWKVGRTLRKEGNRDGIRRLLFDAIPQLSAAQPNAQGWGLVQQLSAQIPPMNCGVRPTSLVSKFAFSCAPVTFAPYDRIVRGRLGTPDHDYLAYTSAFAERQADVERQLAAFPRPDGKVGLTAANLPLNGYIMDDRVFVGRTADWYL